MQRIGFLGLSEEEIEEIEERYREGAATLSVVAAFAQLGPWALRR